MSKLRELYDRCDVSNNRVDAIGFEEFKQAIKDLIMQLWNESNSEHGNEPPEIGIRAFQKKVEEL